MPPDYVVFFKNILLLFTMLIRRILISPDIMEKIESTKWQVNLYRKKKKR